MTRFLLYATSNRFANQLVINLSNYLISGLFVSSPKRLLELTRKTNVTVWIVYVEKYTEDLLQLIELDPTIKKILICMNLTQENIVQLWSLKIEDLIEYPCSNRELMLRIKRHFLIEDETISIFGTQFNASTGRFQFGTICVYLSQLERRLLTCLANNKQEYRHREVLLSSVWPVGVFASDDALDVLIRRLRIKLRPYAITIASRRGYGYSLRSGTDKTDI